MPSLIGSHTQAGVSNMTGYLESKTSFLAFLLTDDEEDGPTPTTPGFSADVISAAQHLSEVDLEEEHQSPAPYAIPPEEPQAPTSPASPKLSSKSGKKGRLLGKVFKREGASGKHDDTQKSMLKKGSDNGFDGTPAPLEVRRALLKRLLFIHMLLHQLQTRVSDFTGTYQRVLLFRRGSREILFATDQLLSSCGLQPKSKEKEGQGSASIIQMDILKLVSGKTKAESESVRAKLTNAIKNSEGASLPKYGDAPQLLSAHLNLKGLSVVCGLHLPGDKATCWGFLHVSPLMDKPGDCVAFVAIFEPESQSQDSPVAG
ncbi:hypothetical protein P7C70_g760, partial [Phenoliferia sp. Uapishka_3]